VTAMQRQIDVEETRDALKDAVRGVAAAVPQMLASGADPSNIISQFATLVAKLQHGDQFEEAAKEAFAASQQQPQPPGTPPSPAGLSGPPSGSPGMPPPAPGPGGPGGSPAGGPTPGGGPPPALADLLARMTGKGVPAGTTR